ncbi:MAG: hypothetical protein ACRCS8_02895 [Brevinema sp.]
MQSVIEKILKLRFLPIIDFSSMKNPKALVETMLEDNVSILQVNFKTDEQLQESGILNNLLKEFPEMSLGAGFINEANDANIVLKNGADFVISSVLATEILPIASQYQKTAIVSALSPTEIHTANKLTPELVQIFPAAQLPSRSLLSILDHMPKANLLLTGGLTLSLALELLQYGVKAVGVKGSIFRKEDLAEENYASISDAIKNFYTRIERLNLN